MENTADLAAAVLRSAAAEFRDAHAQALGVGDTQIRGLTAKRDRRLAAAAAEFQEAIDAAANAAQSTVLHAARVIDGYRHTLLDQSTVPAGLRAARFVELGELRVGQAHPGVPAAPLVVPFLGRASISVTGDPGAVEGLVRKIILEAILGTTPGQLSVIAYDPHLRNPLAPFARLAADRDPNLIGVVHQSRDLDRLIDTLGKTVIRVGNVLLGGPDGLVEHRLKTGTPVEQFTLVSFHDYPDGVSEQQHSSLIRLARVAPRHGIVFLFHIPDPAAAPEWMDISEIRELGESFTASTTSGAISWAREPSFDVVVPDATASTASAAVDTLITAAEEQTAATFSSLLPSHEWTSCSADGLTVAIAQDGSGPVQITFDDSVVHGLITGATGMGKSNLINVLIYGLAARYAPDELEFYLLDFKEGATLAPLAATPSSPDFLPHARILGMEADQDFGLSVLLEIERIYKRRLAEMRPLDNIKDYREAHPDTTMPRLVVIIDEFQDLLAQDADRAGRQAAEKLLFLVSKVRAAGIHIVLATQDIGAVDGLFTTRDGVLAQIALRIGLKNTPPAAARTFTVGNEASAALRGRGDVVINRSFGAKHANQVAVVPLANRESLSALRQHWCRQRPDTGPPAAFYGSAPAHITDDITNLTTDVAASAADRVSGAARKVLLGRSLSVSQSPVAFTLDPIPGRNLAVVGSGGEVAEEIPGHEPTEPINPGLGILTSCGLALAAQHPPETADFVILDLLAGPERHNGRVPEWLETMGSLGHTPHLVQPASIIDWVTEKASQLRDRDGTEQRPTYVFGLAFDRVSPTIIERPDSLGAIAPLKHLQDLWQNGPVHGIHCFFWWSTGPQFLVHTDRKFDTFFSGTVVLPGAGEAGQRILSAVSPWAGDDNRALFRDSLSSPGARKVIPYRPLAAEALLRFSKAVRP
jgi:hypothetical protein